MSKERISLDDLLAEQSTLRATIERVLGDDDRVTATPFIAGSGCACAYAITIAKDSIESLSITGEVHDCCGKRLRVVEVEFTDASVADIFRQLSESSARSTPNPRLGQRRSVGRFRSRPLEDPDRNPEFDPHQERVRQCEDLFEACSMGCEFYEYEIDRIRCQDHCYNRRRRYLGY
ncbi:hypothetical protein [Streptomyces sp. NPDC091371]|uniref:hypothetical protein n=1 Tax=Streptomyces sp. NPDC091371 TaxID=3155303 RepID=UPI00343A1BEF